MTDVTENYTAFLNQVPNITNESIWNRLLAQSPVWFGNEQFFGEAFNSPPKDTTVLNKFMWTFNIVGGNISQLSGQPEYYGNYAQYQYIVRQMRLGPNVPQFMTDTEQLDLFAEDFFGDTLPRFLNESNATYKVRISANLFSIKGTRLGMQQALFNLTGFEPIIFEPWSIFNACFYGYDVSGRVPISNCAYGLAKYGSTSYAYQAFIDVIVSPVNGLGNYYPGYDLPEAPTPPKVFPPYPLFSLGGYHVASGGNAIYGGNILLQAIIRGDQVTNVINNTKVFGTRIWYRIDFPPPV